MFIHGFDCGLGKTNDDENGDETYWCRTGGFINNDVPGSEQLMKQIMRALPPYFPSPFTNYGKSTIEEYGYKGYPPTAELYDMESMEYVNSTLTQSVPPYAILDPSDGDVTYGGDACPSVPPERPIALEDFPNLYPAQCPTSVSLQLGMVSFSYVRADIMPDVYLQSYEEGNKQEINNVWPGPGMIFQYNKDTEFWQDGRVAAFYPADAYSLLRAACGIGRGLPELQFLLSPNDVQTLTNYTIENVTGGEPVPWCPHNPKSPEDIKAISRGLDSYCPGWIDSLYSYNSYNEFATRQLIDMGLTERDAREFAYCALDDYRFDDIFIPAATQSKRVDISLDTPGVPAYWYYSNAKWNEVLIKSWGGVSLEDLAKETIMYVLTSDGTEITDKAFQYARWLSELTGIPVPTVFVSNDGFFRTPEFYPGTEIRHPNFTDPLKVRICVVESFVLTLSRQPNSRRTFPATDHLRIRRKVSRTPRQTVLTICVAT